MVVEAEGSSQGSEEDHSLCVWDNVGGKEMIDFLLATSESQNAWEGFLRDLYVRGIEVKFAR